MHNPFNPKNLTYDEFMSANRSRKPRPKSQRTAYSSTTRRKTGNLALAFTQELKHYDTYLVNTAVANNVAGAELDPTTILCISAPAQGDTTETRDGKEIIIKSASVRGHIYWPPNTETTQPIRSPVSLWMVLDTQTNLTQLNSEDVFTNPSTDTALMDRSFRDLLSSGNRYKVLAKATVYPPTATAQPSGGNYIENGRFQPFEMYTKKTLNLKVKFSGTGAGVSAVVDNSIHIIGSRGYSTASTQPLIYYNARIRFIG